MDTLENLLKMGYKNTFNKYADFEIYACGDKRVLYDRENDVAYLKYSINKKDALFKLGKGK